MTKKTKYFLLGSGATLAVGLSAGLMAYYMGFPTVAFQRADGPAELSYVPREASLVAYANVRDVMNSELRQRIRQMTGDSDGGQEQFRQRTGINIETDIDRIVACVIAENQQSELSDPGSAAPGSAAPGRAAPGRAAPGRAADDDGLVLARGRFDAVRIEGFAREHGGQIEAYKGKRLVTHRRPSAGADGRGENALGFIQPDLVAVGSGRLVRRAIDLEAGGQNITANEDVMKMVRDVDDGNAWAVGRFDALASRAKLPAGVASQIPPITWVAARGYINGGFTGMVQAEARDEAAAQNLRDVIRGFMALAKLQAGSQPEMQTMLQSLELGGTGKTVALSFTVPLQVLDAIAPRQRRRPEP